MNHTSDSAFSDLLIAMLAVNSYPLFKAIELRPALDELELFAPERLNELDWQEIFDRLKRAGYDKSNYVVSLLTDRVTKVAESFVNQDLEEKILSHEARGQSSAIREALLPLHGIGPKVLENFLNLREARLNS